MMLPSYIRHGHGFLILRDLWVDKLLVDGIDVGDPKSTSHSYFTGSFRGYFNVPPGPHTIEAQQGGKSSVWKVDVQPNEAYVKRTDWDQGGWVDDEPATEKQYKDLARSGSMLQSKALRPWPLTSIYVCNAPKDLLLNGVPVRCSSDFLGITNLKPGLYVLESGNFRAQFELPVESMQVIDFSGGKPDLINPRMADPMLRIYLGRAPKEALIRAEDMGMPPAGDPKFGDGDLNVLDEMYRGYKNAPGDSTLARYIEVLRRNYVVDTEMAKQSEYYCRYADAIIRHVKETPALKTSPARTYFNYLAEDMQDTGVAAAAAKGKELGALLD